MPELTVTTESTDLQAAENPEAGNQATSNWRDGVERELRFSKDGNDRLARFSDPSVMATSYLRLENSQSGMVKIPVSDSPPEEVSAFFVKLGRPETAEGYTVPVMEENEEFNKEFFSTLATAALAGGVTGGQFDKMVIAYRSFEKRMAESELTEFNRRHEESTRLLHDTYGADYDKNIELSSRAYTEYASDDLKELLETDKFIAIKNEPAFIDMLYNIGRKNMDDTFVKGDSKGDVPGDKDFVPESPNSAEMYAHGTDEASIKARAYFTAKGHKY